MKNTYLYLIIFCCFQHLTYSQFQQSVFPQLTGIELFEQLQENYTPVKVLPYSEARDVMYSNIYNHNDSVYGVYSNYALYLPPNADPSTYLWMNGSANGINTEHTYPRSKGADEDSGNGFSDMHHLFPTRAAVNEARLNYPFSNIVDEQTSYWYRHDQRLTVIPSTQIDQYSEKVTGFFEPREDHKGNVARAMFYFYTIYRQQADAADPDYFEIQRQTLCSWHYQDPVDEKEWERNIKIASFQDDKPNPFILDCTLASRIYCLEFPENCLLTSIIPKQLKKKSIKVFPNPIKNGALLSFTLERSSDVKYILTNMYGKMLYQSTNRTFPKGLHTMKLKLNSIPSGIYNCAIFVNEKIATYKLVIW